jgi:putative ABC transport system permease protein
MNEVFGISMNAIMVTFLILLALCLCVTLYIALRQRVVFRMGMRNIPRRRAQTALIVVGLMLSTLISTAALGMGDTIDRSLKSEAYGVLGQVDELVLPSATFDADTNASYGSTMPEGALQIVEQRLAGDPNVDGIIPALYQIVPAINSRNGLATPTSYIIGVDPARTEQFGGLQATNGDTIDLAALPQGQVVISKGMVDEVEAKAGDTLTVFYNNQPTELVVAAIAKDSPLSGVLSTSDPYGLVMPLDRLQAATGKAGQLSFIAVSNTGGVEGGIGRTDAVTQTLQPALEGQGYGVDTIKQSLADQSAAASSGLTGLFLVLGLFSIAVGVLLIILIFSMLAAERRAEMGMARAVGQQRFQLIQQFIAEGSGYALLSGIVGAAAGTGVILILARILQSAVGDFFSVSPYVSWRSIIVGYCLGVILTFLAIVVASFRASQLNVVAAIRDLPDRVDPKRRRRTLVTASLMVLIGALMVYAGYTGNSARTFLFYFGMSLLPFGIASFGRWFGVPARPLYSLVGIYLLVLWFLPAKQAKAIFGDVVSGGDFEMFFLIGVFSVAGVTVLIVQNLDLLLKGFGRIGTVFGNRLAAIKLAVAYPGANVGRTGLTIAMFSLIVFSLVAFATISENFSRIFISDKSSAGWDVQVVVQQANQLPNEDLVGALTAAGADTADITAVGAVNQLNPVAQARQLTSPDPTDVLATTPRTIGLDSFSPAYLQNTDLSFQARAAGYADDAAITNALINQPDVAVVDTATLSQNGGGGFGGSDTGLLLEGIGNTDQGFAPVAVDVVDSQGQPHTVNVIGVIDQDISSLFGLYVGQATGQRIVPEPQQVTYNLTLSDPDNATDRSKQIGSALLSNGAVSQSYDEINQANQGTFSGFLLLIQGFMGLGLIVGIAAVGVIAFRSVIERRQQIGVLRAIGYGRSLVSLSFLIETVFIVGLGVISGTILALVTAWQLFQDPAFTGGTGATSIVVPWGLVLVVLAITFGFALLMTWVPSRQAASIRPAEALRYE